MRFFFVIATLLAIASCAERPAIKTLQGEAFGTTFSIQFYASDEFAIEKGIDSVIYVVNRSVSTYMYSSDISKINRGDSTVIIDPVFRDVFDISERVYKTSNGYFDPTIGVLRNAYGFGDTEPIINMDSKTVDSLMKFVGFHKVSISDHGTVVKKDPNIYFDFNAVAKGYAIDCLGRYMESEGVSNYLIELGGEILARGKNISRQRPWIVGIENVDSELDNRSYKSTVALKDLAMAASGNYRKYRIDSVTGKKYVHTINPLTGSAEQSDVTSATVIMKTCGDADAYATALMAMGLERSKQLLTENSGIEAYLTYIDSLGNPQIFMTKGLESLLVD